MNIQPQWIIESGSRAQKYTKPGLLVNVTQTFNKALTEALLPLNA